MKKNIIFFVASLLLLSCNNKELETKLKSLQQENKKLKDSIVRFNYNKIISSEMIILPSNNTNEVKFDGMIYNRLDKVSYDLYQLDTLHYIEGVTKKVIFKNNLSSQFQIKADESLIKNNILYLMAEYNLDSLKVQIPGVLYLK
ncbi:hypothetical protein [Tenacibaculum larymnensis]|uniref:Lipoprotein n=1 Tax=Tenacibaculum larymnensis TaxID=2878201 RepID=A0A9X4ETU9_9FLAO|nr:hypothetical protein [Tenacibaculum larymnensis]MDE1208457.1 hypothetical protein [Tenacibaculum larymnensis]